MKSRAVLLGTGGYPYIISYWLNNLQKWIDKVDKVYIVVDHYDHHEFKDFLHGKINNPKIVLLEEVGVGWPTTYAYAFNKSKEDVFLIMHDDCYVINPDFLEECFQICEKGEVVTPLHEIYAPKDKTEEWLNNKFPNTFPLVVDRKEGEEAGWKGYSFLLYFLFVPRKDMENTSLYFGGSTFEGTMNGDTGFRFMIEMLEHDSKIHIIPRFSTTYLAFEDDPFKELQKWDFNKIPYIHLQNTGNTIPMVIEGDKCPIEWKHMGMHVRLGWLYEWMRMDDYSKINWHMEKTKKRLREIIDTLKLDEDIIIKFSNVFHKLMYP